MSGNSKTSYTVITSASVEQIADSLRFHDDSVVVGVIGEMTIPDDLLGKVKFTHEGDTHSIASMIRQRESFKERFDTVSDQCHKSEAKIADIYEAVLALIKDNDMDEEDEFVQAMLELGMPNPFTKPVCIRVTFETTVELTVNDVPSSFDEDDLCSMVIEHLQCDVDASLDSLTLHLDNDEWVECSVEIDSVDPDDFEANVQ